MGGGMVWSHHIYMIFCGVAFISDDHTPFLDHSSVHTGGEPR